MEKVVKVRVPTSTSNIGPGFESMGAAINIYSYLTAEITKYDMLEIIIIGKHPGATIPLDKTNTVYKAIEYVHNRLKLPLKGLKLTMELNAPVAKGLGSRATAISAGVYIANELLDKPLSLQQMIDIASAIEGSPADVIPILAGGFVICGKGTNNIPYTKIHFPPALKFIAVIPDFEIHDTGRDPTKTDMRMIPVSDAVYNLSNSAMLATGLSNNDYKLIAMAMGDKIHQNLRGGLVPGLAEVTEAGITAGALGCYLSGTGPTICALVHKDIDKVGSVMSKKWAESGIKAEYRILELDPHGITLM